MARNSKTELVRLVINMSIIAGLVVLALFLIRRCTADEDGEWELENHPLRVENIRKIAELSTVSYTDEVVSDSIEYYEDFGEQFAGNVSKLADLESWKYAVRGSAIKRRLTLIVGGEVRYGFDLKDTTFRVTYSGDTVFVQTAAPKILDVIVVPSKTTIFQEHGQWQDNARIQLQQKARLILAVRSGKMELEQKSKQQLESLLKKLLADKRKLIVTYR
ncbi:DUF4230 domain-containing protein [Crocinitomicaceae bacterium CZZ-1]|uniref:DUF4230 domain-containing protein n=1 Tax=Taishania pollutisoli TaxID=2766479 RepID=A0A8J6TTU1_9FLAO|nr:DUF4230 domain-containing protein [Taishania pollutisoli]MBC9813657.1 DUF4230 domain-containing protein [Taishania pollutisoli]MBX2949520.1 DUF4230 domain-containing protein [Crocinitomicaceae bacterium]NGF74599.1 DUF4230 domain-containing protein [Fluviicola sp. SGL-29]